jgi:antitoxin (DNA-binding transcriptional repressor) of toxin-antitoxin stability system
MYLMGKRYTVATLRERLAEALDAADQGVSVIIERRGVRYRLTAEAASPKRAGRHSPRIDVVDPAVTRGEWTWQLTVDGLGFDGTRRR